MAPVSINQLHSEHEDLEPLQEAEVALHAVEDPGEHLDVSVLNPRLLEIRGTKVTIGSVLFALQFDAKLEALGDKLNEDLVLYMLA